MRLQALARAVAFFALFSASFFCRAQEHGGTLVPPEIFVGDEAVFTYIEENLSLLELSYSPELGASAVAAIEVPRELLPADSSDISVKKVRLIPLQGREDAALCEITFVPWKTGEIVIPDFAFSADGAKRSRAVKVAVSSLAERYGVTALMSNRPPLLPPGTIYLLYALVLCIAAACFFIVLAVRRLLARGKASRRIPVKKIRREFARLLKAQARRIGKDQAAWYAEFSAVVRLFFYKMTNERKYLAADARDIAQFLEAAQSSSGEIAPLAEKLIAALREIERIRFSGESAAEDSRSERECKSSYIKAFEEFMLLACAAPEVFFGTVGESAAPRKKGRSRAVV